MTDFDTAVSKIARRKAIMFFAPRLTALAFITTTFVYLYGRTAQ